MIDSDGGWWIGCGCGTISTRGCATLLYIWNFSHGYLDVPTVASKVGVARRTLDVRFRSASGRSVLEEIQHCRLTIAAMLLRETEDHRRQARLLKHRSGGKRRIAKPLKSRKTT